MEDTHQNTDGGYPQNWEDSSALDTHSVLFRYAKMNRGYFPSSFFVCFLKTVKNDRDLGCLKTIYGTLKRNELPSHGKTWRNLKCISLHEKGV